MTPNIIDPVPFRRRLPPMQTAQDAANLNVQHRTTFYISAFMFQCWLSELTLSNTAQLAEKPDPKDRSFQTGEAWRGFFKMFGQASDAEFPAFYGHLMEFAEYDDPFAAHLIEAVVGLSIEHDLTGEFLGPRTPAVLGKSPEKLLALMRRSTVRLCDWLDSALQFRVFLKWHIMPDCFDPDPQKRELACLAHNQRHFDTMSERAQVHWLNHMSDAVQELPNSPKWAAFREFSSAPPPERRPWPSQSLDRAIIKIWPLVKHHHWSAADLLYVLRKVLSPGDLAPCPDQTALAAYCAGTLGLRDVGFNQKSKISRTTRLQRCTPALPSRTTGTCNSMKTKTPSPKTASGKVTDGYGRLWKDIFKNSAQKL